MALVNRFFEILLPNGKTVFIVVLIDGGRPEILGVSSRKEFTTLDEVTRRMRSESYSQEEFINSVIPEDPILLEKEQGILSFFEQVSKLGIS